MNITARLKFRNAVAYSMPQSDDDIREIRKDTKEVLQRVSVVETKITNIDDRLESQTEWARKQFEQYVPVIDKLNEKYENDQTKQESITKFKWVAVGGAVTGIIAFIVAFAKTVFNLS